MRRLTIIASGLLLAGSAAAAPDVRGQDEVVVYDTDRIATARRRLTEVLASQRYRETGRRGDYTVYKRGGAGHPTLLVHDDGWVRLREQPLSFRFVNGRIGFDVSGPRVGLGNTTRVLDAIDPALTAVNDAVASRAMDTRENVDIPDELAALWARTDLPPEARREMLAVFWESRTETPEGERARRAAERFIYAVVQTSDTPFTAEEVARINRRREVVRELVVR